ncbi:adenylosuccinate synthase [Candidatus Daviesbacteria bacterium]|nr:adenylosuccinate synthase [Candidatus Daviesbacteria bacterium]
MSTENPVAVINGGQWGDEGKGKVADLLAQSADIVIRAQGGDNAGHTVVNPQGEFKLHLIPSGVFNPDVLNILGPGMVISLTGLIGEVSSLAGRGFVNGRNLMIDPRAHFILSYHQQRDQGSEKSLGEVSIGTTGRGIGPAYTDKAERIGLRIGLLRDPDRCMTKLAQTLAILRERSYPGTNKQLLYPEMYEGLIGESSRMFKDLIRDSLPVVRNSLNENKRVVVEGAQGTLLDLDFGTYPDVTSSNTVVSGLLVGAGIPSTYPHRAIGVFKAYQSRVGNGGMPTELKNELGDRLRNKGNEFGTTTGRPRRVGYFDGVAAKYSAALNGYTDFAVTRIDVLTGFDPLMICRAYKRQDEAGKITDFPIDDAQLRECSPYYPLKDRFPGWEQDISRSTNTSQWPKQARAYLEALEDTIRKGAPNANLWLIGTGPDRDAFIKFYDIW